MMYPSQEFDTTIARLCHGTESDADIAALHAIVQTDAPARDDYLWQVELHGYLMTRAIRRDNQQATPVPPGPHLSPGKLHATRAWYLGAAAAALAFVCGLYWPFRSGSDLNPEQAELETSAPPTPSAADRDSIPDGSTSAAAGLIRSTVLFAHAADAPILIGTGGLEPLELGADVPYASRADTLHVWDWSRSPRSQVLPDVRLWPGQRICLSPDGTWLVWGAGDVLNLVTGVRSKIDLGGEVHVGRKGGTLERIEHLEFTPEGGRLALLVSEVVLHESTHPLRRNDVTTSPSFQIVDFAAGTLVSQFPAGVPASLPLAFSRDGSKVASQSAEDEPGSAIVERVVTTGEQRHVYAPRLQKYATALSWSPDGSSLAVIDSAGEVLLWNSQSGELQHRVELPGHAGPADLRFSPDGKLLAVSLFPGIAAQFLVIDVASGAVVGRSSQDTFGEIFWAADSQSLTVLYTQRGILEQRDQAGRMVMYNRFPTVRTWKIADLPMP